MIDSAEHFSARNYGRSALAERDDLFGAVGATTQRKTGTERA